MIINILYTEALVEYIWNICKKPVIIYSTFVSKKFATSIQEININLAGMYMYMLHVSKLEYGSAYFRIQYPYTGCFLQRFPCTGGRACAVLFEPQSCDQSKSDRNSDSQWSNPSVSPPYWNVSQSGKLSPVYPTWIMIIDIKHNLLHYCLII